MSNFVPTSTVKQLILALAFTMLAAISLATAAHAQTSFGKQYGSPTASGEAAIHHSGDSASTASSDAPGSNPISVLPSTGGMQLSLVAAGALGLSALGLIAVRRSRR